MIKVILEKGLPASGKTTWAKSIVDKYPNAYKRINKDDLRSMLDVNNHTQKSEKFISKARDALILLSIEEGKHVIVDDTNLNPIHEKHIRELVKDKKNVKVEIKYFTHVPLNECIKNDLKRNRSVGKDVIVEMYNKYLKPKDSLLIQNQLAYKTPTIICDLDGTLFHMKDRSPYDWKRVGEDEVDLAVKSILEQYNGKATILLVSGRDECCRKDTEYALWSNDIKYDALYMRKENDQRKDTIVKEEIYNQHIKGKYNVLFAIDDRKTVVDMWRNLGLKCFEAQENLF